MRRLYGSLILLAGLGLAALSWKANRDADRAAALAGTLEQLRAAVPTLTDEVLKLRAAMSRNQDGVVRSLLQAALLLDQADGLAAQIGPDHDLDPAVSLKALRTLLEGKEQDVERLRSDGAVVKNSLEYLIDLERGGTTPPDGLNDLVRNALLYERASDPATGERIRSALVRLEAARGSVSKDAAEDLRFADAHARRILELGPRIETALQRLAAHTLEPSIDTLRAQIGRRHEEASSAGLAYRDAAFAIGLLFVLSFALALRRDRRRHAELDLANAELELRVDARTRQLADHEAETRAILEGSAEGILSVEENGTIRSVNPAIAAMFGHPPGALQGKPFGGIVSPAWDEVRAAGTKKRDGTGTRIDGQTFPLEIQSNEVRLGERRIYSVMLRDVTEIRRAEQLKNEFISTVSHELRTPLTSIRGALGLVSSGVLGPLPVKAKPMVDIATKNCERLVNLVSDILDIEKVSCGKMAFKMRTLSLSDLVAQTVDATRGFAESLGVTLSVAVRPGDTLVLADSDRLTQVLTNLVSNACKYSPKGATVAVDVVRLDAKFRVSVRDLGPGIPDEFRPRIFQKFAQADMTDGSQRKGTGLGLAISKALIERMAGAIGFDSTLGEGSTFWFDLNEERPVAPIASTSARPRLLVCEDERDISEVLRLLLTREGYDSDLASTLKQARELMATRTYSGMTLDLSLPDGSGLTLLKELRQNPATRELPVIVISANLEQNRQALSGSAFGLVDWLEKPIATDRLEQALRRAGSAEKRPRVLHVEDDEDIANVVLNLLSPSAEVVQARTVISAWEKLKAEDFDLLILDINLPDGSGLELLPALRKSTNTPIPSMVFSAHEISPRTASTVTAALLKSRTSNEMLVQRVKQLLARRPGAVKV